MWDAHTAPDPKGDGEVDGVIGSLPLLDLITADDVAYGLRQLKKGHGKGS